MADKKIIAIDFDGVLHSFKSGWTKANDIPDPPTRGAIAWLMHLMVSDGISVVIFSARNEDAAGVIAMKQWLLKYGLPELYVFAIDFPIKKPACHLLIDDRCFCFKGKFPTMSEIDDFVPWHGNGVW